jgi:tRNA G18 (ribose-2'-O)-methylase SpoU
MPLTKLLEEARITKPLCLVVGNEVSGVSAEALALSDIVADLPMKGMKESLNVSVAFGIAAYALSEKT